jgi:Mn-containing catalase
MFYSDGKLQYPVRVDKPNPIFARMLQQAIGGTTWRGRSASRTSTCSRRGGSRGPKKYRDMLLATATEELAHIEMLRPPWPSTSRGRP